MLVCVYHNENSLHIIEDTGFLNAELSFSSSGSKFETKYWCLVMDEDDTSYPRRVLGAYYIYKSLG